MAKVEASENEIDRANDNPDTSSDESAAKRSDGGGNVRSVYMTFPDESSAVAVAGKLLEEHLIACANILPGARSIYRWQGETADEPEVVAFAKTVEDRLPTLVRRVTELHPYETPCVVALPAVAGNVGYMEWVGQETRAGTAFRQDGS
jgi:periplasmic divalent cation tolerance protein